MHLFSRSYALLMNLIRSLSHICCIFSSKSIIKGSPLTLFDVRNIGPSSTSSFDDNVALLDSSFPVICLEELQSLLFSVVCFKGTVFS